jgi:hypothetical protein
MLSRPEKRFMGNPREGGRRRGRSGAARLRENWRENAEVTGKTAARNEFLYLAGLCT